MWRRTDVLPLGGAAHGGSGGGDAADAERLAVGRQRSHGQRAESVVEAARGRRRLQGTLVDVEQHFQNSNNRKLRAYVCFRRLPEKGRKSQQEISFAATFYAVSIEGHARRRRRTKEDAKGRGGLKKRATCAFSDEVFAQQLLDPSAETAKRGATNGLGEGASTVREGASAVLELVE